eukprot:3479641-Lingulodinium_polyedra.AAC.1
MPTSAPRGRRPKIASWRRTSTSAAGLRSKRRWEGTPSPARTYYVPLPASTGAPCGACADPR